MRRAIRLVMRGAGRGLLAAVAAAVVLVVSLMGGPSAIMQGPAHAQQLQGPVDGVVPPRPPRPVPRGPDVAPATPESIFPDPPAGKPLVLPSAPSSRKAPAPRGGKGVLRLVARYGSGEAPAINGGLHWRIYSDRPDPAGGFRLVKEEEAAQPSISLPAGNYIVHVAFGLVSAVRSVQVQGDTREVFELPAGGLTLAGQVGNTRIPAGQITFDIFRGSQFDQQEREAPVVANVASGEMVILPEGTYYVVSKYGDGNALVRSDIRVQAGSLTDVTVTHRAAVMMLRLVSRRGGEALANTEWVVLSPSGDIVTETRGAFPQVILAEGEYRVVARNEDRTYQQDFAVVPGVDGEVEVLAR